MIFPALPVFALCVAYANAEPRYRMRRQSDNNPFDFHSVPTACLEGEKGFYRNPYRPKDTDKEILDGCSEFYRCSGGAVFRLKCPPGTRFNVVSQVCEAKLLVKLENCAYDRKSDEKIVVEAQPNFDSSNCFEGQYQCGSGQCMDKDLFCDNNDDCDDGSDERKCSLEDDPNAADPCDPLRCFAPECFCSNDGEAIPQDHVANQVPQMVLLMFDDAINDANFELYRDLLTRERSNPGGQCRIKATFFTQHAYTNYRYVELLAKDGHEIAVKAVDQEFGEQFLGDANSKVWERMIVDNQQIITKFARLANSTVKGMRAPYLMLGGNAQYEMIKNSGLIYDSSIAVGPRKVPVWPYTLDFKIPHECYPKTKKCPARSFPGIWELPLNTLQGLWEESCSQVSSCNHFEDEDEVVEFFNANLERHYETNRAPLVLSMNTNWLSIPEQYDGLKKWIDSILNGRRNDVYFITGNQLVEWMKQPTPITTIPQFEPWQCQPNFNAFSAASEEGSVCTEDDVNGCNLEPVDDDHRPGFMFTCLDCPSFYPDVGIPDGETLQTANAQPADEFDVFSTGGEGGELF